MLKRSQNAGAAVWSAVSRIFSGAGSTVDSGNQALPEKNSRPEAQVSGLCFCFTPGLEAGNIFSRTIAR
ncbi:hypothetical protein BRUCa_1328 [Brucella melitensis]